MEVLSRDREITILVDSESQRDIEQTVDDIKDIRANIALNVDGRNVDLPKDVSVIVTTVLESLMQGLSCGHFNHTKGIADHSCGGNAWNFSTHFVEIGS